ncbi:DMT family transporter [Novosphingobium sp. KCTC 2891]|uniref:DMT family transporter n=1 Tax=Novosphingobium sp. KCTC 2891 TaxID=2989730 RepID=UPI0022236D9C|nr:DMT family transporter [Novosphingobium sp. KCTC 2891]MCW1381997.1 DMT family transporter [Novosphingobium sp. KCTC 2891]
MSRPSLLLPILVTLAGLACFGVMDGVMKAASIAVGPYGAMFWRGLLGALFMLPLWLRSRRRDGARGWPGRAVMRVHLLRGAVAAVMAVTFFYGLVRTPIAEAIALSFIAPLLALYLAAVLLGETVGRRAVVGSVLALAGVAVIAAGKFGGDYSAEGVKGLAAILVSAVLYAWNLVLQRQQAQLASPEEIAFFQSGLAFVLLAPGALVLAPMPDPATWGVIAAAAVLATTSLMLLGWAYARAEAQVLVPLEYTAFIWAALVGWIAFAEPLTWRTLAGVTLIVAGCLFASRRGEPHLEPA